jgi:hypothetical protein
MKELLNKTSPWFSWVAVCFSIIIYLLVLSFSLGAHSQRLIELEKAAIEQKVLSKTWIDKLDLITLLLNEQKVTLYELKAEQAIYHKKDKEK